ncbi:MAG: FAD/FMN-containing dehydrogenase [Halieaceae bacterium]|jgi:FAD/FMN-containing dehydrogenase
MHGTTGDIVESLVEVCGADAVILDAEERAFYAQDLFDKGSEPAAVVRPRSTDEMVAVVLKARAAGVPLFIRGGGMSYTRAFLPTQAGAVLVDSSALDDIHEINTEDGYVTVGAGCTWKKMDAALAEHGVRTTFWGPFSGARATVGGSLSQGSATFGSGQTGTTAPAILALEVVTGNGEVLRTGMDSQKGHSPFFRHYGPDITGLFTHDSGALGIKTQVTLALEERPRACSGVSLAFADFDGMFAAMRDAAKTGLASEIIGMDAEIAGIQAGERGLLNDLKKLRTIVFGADSLRRGLASGLHAVLRGGAAFRDAAYTAHFIADARSDRLLEAKLLELRAVVSQYGVEIPNAAIGMIRATPFPDLPLTHTDGRRMLPIHGIFSNSKMVAFRADYLAYLESQQDAMREARVQVVETYAGLGRNGFLYEPVWYWEDSLSLYHERVAPSAMMQNLPRFPTNMAGRELVETMKTDIINIMFKHGAAHLQIGRVYPYLRDRDAATTELLRAAKAHLDGEAIVNPGTLGL